jgi:O-antigen/teichoic acid export membrane protein
LKGRSLFRVRRRVARAPEPAPAERSFARDGIVTVAITAAKLAVGLLTGIIIARALGPDGRGALTAILTAPQILGWLFGMGSGAAVAYHLSRDASCGGRLLTTWLLIMIPFNLAAVIAAEALLPTLLSAQSPETLALARLYVATIAMVIVSDLLIHFLLGAQDFGMFNLLGFGQPAGVALGYGGLWLAGAFSVESALIPQALMSFVVMIVAAVRVIGRHGFGRIDLDLGRRSFWYALRTHGEIVSGLVNQRLDLLIIPAYLSAVAVGYYAIATSVSWLVVSISGALATIVMPAAAARAAESGRQLVLRSFHATLVIGLVLGGGLFVLADPAVWLVYGPEFAPSVLSLRVLLPGAILYAAAGILLKGLYVENRPFTATLCQALGMAATLIGLLLFLGRGGIVAAAAVSTIAYALVFVAAAVLYRRAAGLSWTAFLPEPALIADGARRLVERLPKTRRASV